MANSTKVGQTIRRIRRERGLTLEQVADKAETDTGNLSRIERGKQGYTDKGLRLIAKALGVDVADLFRDATAAEPSPAPYNSISEPAVIKIAHFQAPASMGIRGMEMADDVVVDEVQINQRWVRTNLPDITNPKNLTFVTGYGDSMEDTFFHGDVLFVDRGVNELKIDAVYVFELDRELFIKRLQRLPGGAVKVISDNRKYESYVVDGNGHRSREMRILGRVVGAWNWRQL